MQITSPNLQVLPGRVLLPGLGDVGEFPGGLVQPGESMLGPDNQLILLGLVRDVGGDPKFLIVSHESRTKGALRFLRIRDRERMPDQFKQNLPD